MPPRSIHHATQRRHSRAFHEVLSCFDANNTNLVLRFAVGQARATERTRGRTGKADNRERSENVSKVLREYSALGKAGAGLCR
jgi:hypothetical protein